MEINVRDQNREAKSIKEEFIAPQPTEISKEATANKSDYITDGAVKNTLDTLNTTRNEQS